MRADSLTREPLAQDPLGKVSRAALGVGIDPHHGAGRVVGEGQAREAEVGELDRAAPAAEGEIERKPAVDVKAAARAGQQHALAARESLEQGNGVEAHGWEALTPVDTAS